MSLVKWLGIANPKLKGQFAKPSTPGLPDPNREKNPADAALCSAANDAIDDAMQDVAGTPAKRKKRGLYHRYDAELRCRMAKFSNLHGVVKASRHFSTELGHEVSYTSIQSMQRQFRGKLQGTSDPARIESLPHLPRGRPLLLGPQLDAFVCKHLRTIRECGGIVLYRLQLFQTEPYLLYSYQKLCLSCRYSTYIGRGVVFCNDAIE